MPLRISLLLVFTLLVPGCGSPDSPETTGNQPAAENASSTAKEPPAQQDGNAASKLPPAKLPDDLPDDVPIYPGAKTVYVGSGSGGIRQAPATSIQLQTTDPVADVQSFYKSQIEDHQWAITEGTGPSLFNGKKGKRNLTVRVNEMPNQPGTVLIGVIYTTPEPAEGPTRE